MPNSVLCASVSKHRGEDSAKPDCSRVAGVAGYAKGNSVIDDLDESLKALLRESLTPAISEQVSVSFAAPDDEFHAAVTLPAVDLFLYDIRENTELRSNDEYIERLGDGTGLRLRAPVRVDASYLITAWSGTSDRDKSVDEHRLLGEVMRALLRHRTLPRNVLKGSLAGQLLPLPVTTLQPGRLQSLGEFWQALGGKPKAARAAQCPRNSQILHRLNPPLELPDGVR